MVAIGRLEGSIKHYDWGGTTLIPGLLGEENTGEKPFAEYWLGVHPQAMTELVMIDGKRSTLREYLTEHAAALGPFVRKKFGNLPYLLKLLDVKDMLSIQVHPRKADAEKAFAAENARNIPLDAPERNYKDSNHKPELMVAMGEFWLLHGFKPEVGIYETLYRVPELSFLIPLFREQGYKGIYQRVMEMPQDEVNERLQPLLERILPLYQEGKLEKWQADYWAARGSFTFSHPDKTDRGIFSIYLFNLVMLKRGEAIFQDAGLPHAYLEGHNVEIMASSDNVLRGGLTHKHIDVEELLAHVRCEPTYPHPLNGEKRDDGLVYRTTAPDFELSCYHLAKKKTIAFTAVTAEILVVVEGSAEIESKDGAIVLKKGSPAGLVVPGEEVWLTATAPALVFRASVPVKKEE